MHSTWHLNIIMNAVLKHLSRRLLSIWLIHKHVALHIKLDFILRSDSTVPFLPRKTSLSYQHYPLFSETNPRVLQLGKILKLFKLNPNLSTQSSTQKLLNYESITKM